MGDWGTLGKVTYYELASFRHAPWLAMLFGLNQVFDVDKSLKLDNEHDVGGSRRSSSRPKSNDPRSF